MSKSPTTGKRPPSSTGRPRCAGPRHHASRCGRVIRRVRESRRLHTTLFLLRAFRGLGHRSDLRRRRLTKPFSLEGWSPGRRLLRRSAIWKGPPMRALRSETLRSAGPAGNPRRYADLILLDRVSLLRFPDAQSPTGTEPSWIGFGTTTMRPAPALSTCISPI